MAVFEQERHVELVSGANEAFVITSRMVSASIPAQLPHLSVFVLQVNDVDDPKQDTLARVARISDLTVVPIGRDAGIAAPGIEGTIYLSASTINVYDTLETANDAAVALQDRVNALIEAWISFRTEFNAPDPSPAQYTFPRVDASQKTALIAAYKAAKQDRYQKQLAKTEADAALGRAQVDYVYKTNLVAAAQAIAASATTTATGVNTVVGNFSTLLAAGNAFYAANPGGVGAATFQNALSNATLQQVAASSFPGDAAQTLTEASNYATARQTDATTAGVALTAAQSDQITKAQQLTSALATESAALSAVLAVCPDFDKHSIPFVDDNEP